MESECKHPQRTRQCVPENPRSFGESKRLLRIANKRIAELEEALDFPYHEADGQIVIADDDLIAMFKALKRPIPKALRGGGPNE